MIEVLQKVTTFPLELITLPEIKTIYTDGELIHKYYSDTIKQNINGSVSEKELSDMYIPPDPLIGPAKPVASKFTKEQITEIKKRFITYNAIYDKLFANNLNVLEKTDEPTIIIFPIHAKPDKGRVDLNPKVSRYYYDKFDKIKTSILFENNVAYIGLNVFTNETKDEYTNYIRTQFDDIKNLIINHNETIKQNQYRVSANPTTQSKMIKNVLFLIDPDKKGLFTGFYKKQLSKEKNDILNKEYSNFLSSSKFRYRKIEDAGINLTFNNVVNETKRFKQRTNIKIGESLITSDDFDEFISKLKELYKKVIDKQYKEALELSDNVKEVKFYYKIENADKVLEDKIQTGSNKLYYLYKDNTPEKKHVIGHFILISEERGIYRFKEETFNFNKRNRGDHVPNNTDTNKEIDFKNDDGEKNEVSPSPVGAYNIPVKIINKYGVFEYKNLDKNANLPEHKNVKGGEIIPYIDKTEGLFKWFNLRDIDASFLNKDKIKYYSDILFDKKSLVEYLKSKQKYNENTILSYEFLKINDGQELLEYCDFIHKNFKSNIIDETVFDFNPFKIKFDDNVIIKNIRDIIFETNTPIYIRASKETKEEQRVASRDSYKIVEYKLFDDFENDESCKEKEDIYKKDKTHDKGVKKNDDKNKCRKEYNDYTGQKSSLIVIVTKTNIKDVGLLKSTTDCKTKKNKLVYNYKKLFSNVTRRLGFGYVGGSRKKSERERRSGKKRSGKRRLKAKCYK